MYFLHFKLVFDISNIDLWVEDHKLRSWFSRFIVSCKSELVNQAKKLFKPISKELLVKMVFDLIRWLCAPKLNVIFFLVRTVHFCQTYISGAVMHMPPSPSFSLLVHSHCLPSSSPVPPLPPPQWCWTTASGWPSGSSSRRTGSAAGRTSCRRRCGTAWSPPRRSGTSSAWWLTPTWPRTPRATTGSRSGNSWWDIALLPPSFLTTGFIVSITLPYPVHPPPPPTHTPLPSPPTPLRPKSCPCLLRFHHNRCSTDPCVNMSMCFFVSPCRVGRISWTMEKSVFLNVSALIYNGTSSSCVFRCAMIADCWY